MARHRRQVFGEGGRIATAGTAAGMVGALVFSRMIEGIAPGGAAPRWWVWLAPPIVLAAAAAIASLIPARRALMVNPVTVLREEG